MNEIKQNETKSKSNESYSVTSEKVLKNIIFLSNGNISSVSVVLKYKNNKRKNIYKIFFGSALPY